MCNYYILCANPCGNPALCKCSELGTISCEGSLIQYLPQFSGQEKESAIMLDIISTNLTSLHSLTKESWFNLEYIYFSDNQLLKCDEVMRIKTVMTAYIDTNCKPKHLFETLETQHFETQYPLPKSDFQFLWLLFGLFIISPLIGCVRIILKNKTKQATELNKIRKFSEDV